MKIKINNPIRRCTATAVLLISTLTFASAASSNDIKNQLDEAIIKRDAAHQMAESARVLGIDESHYIITHAQEQWKEHDEDAKNLNVRYQTVKKIEEQRKQNAKGRYVGKFKITAYTSNPAENGGYGVTADGTKLAGNEWAIVAADRRYWKMGTKFYIEGVGQVTMRDVGGAIKGSNRFDLLVPRGSADSWGIQYRDVYVVE